MDLKTLLIVAVVGTSIGVGLASLIGPHTPKDLDHNTITQIVMDHKEEILDCYRKDPEAMKKGLRGTVAVSFNVSQEGRAKGAKIDSSELDNSAIEGCVLNRIITIQFPTHTTTETVSVTIPLSFGPS